MAQVMEKLERTPDVAPKTKGEKIVLTGIARSKGKAAGEALVNRQRIGWAFNHVGNEDGKVLAPGADMKGQIVTGKIFVYPTTAGSTSGAFSLYYKCKQSHHGPAGLICQEVHWIDISGAIAGEIPAVDQLDRDPITTIKTGDWVEIDAPEVGEKATVTVTPAAARVSETEITSTRKETTKNVTRPTAGKMKLTQRQQEMLDGKHGEAKQFCMDKLMDFGKAVEATEMVDLVLTLNCCPIYVKDRMEPKRLEKLNAYDLGHSPLYDPIFAMKDAHVADESGTQCGNDPYMMQLDKSHEIAGPPTGKPWNFELPGKGSFKLDQEMVDGYQAGYDMLMKHGWLPWLSCNPYLNTRIPKMGEYAASSESSAACYINTILGARTNRESAVNTVYSAYTGCLPKYGTHLDEFRAAKCIVELTDEVRDNIKGMADWGALGACIANKAQNRIMAVLNLPSKMGPGATKNLISCASPGMNDPMMHLMGYTPESPTLEAAFKGKMPKNPERYKVTMDDIIEMYRYLNSLEPAPGPEKAKPVDIVLVGCPHATWDEVREVARLVKGKKVKDGVKLWVQTDTPTYFMAQHYGDTKAIEDAGGHIFHQTCIAMSPIRHYPEGTVIATSSFKYVKLGAGFGPKWIYGNPEALVNAAVTGVFTPTARWDYWSQPKEKRLASEQEHPLYQGNHPMVD